MPVLRVALSEREEVPKRICAASLIYEVALSVMGALMVGVFFFIDLPELQGHQLRYAALALPVLGLGALHPRVFGPAVDRLLVRLGREPLPVTLDAVRVLEFVVLYAGSFVIGGVAVFVLAYSVYPVAIADIPVFIGAFAIGTFLAMIAFVLPGGIVAREAALAVGLSPAFADCPRGGGGHPRPDRADRSGRCC